MVCIAITKEWSPQLSLVLCQSLVSFPSHYPSEPRTHNIIIHESVYMLTPYYVPSNVYQCVHDHNNNNIILSLFGIRLGGKEIHIHIHPAQRRNCSLASVVMTAVSIWVIQWMYTRILGVHVCSILMRDTTIHSEGTERVKYTHTPPTHVCILGYAPAAHRLKSNVTVS